MDNLPISRFIDERESPLMSVELEEKIKTLENQVIKQEFKNSKFIKEETKFDADIAFKVWGENFKVESGQVRYQPGSNAPILGMDFNSADFDTAMRQIVNAYPERDSILKPKQEEEKVEDQQKTKQSQEEQIPKKLSDFSTRQEKIDYIGKHGQRAYQDLVNRSLYKG